MLVVIPNLSHLQLLYVYYFSVLLLFKLELAVVFEVQIGAGNYPFHEQSFLKRSFLPFILLTSHTFISKMISHVQVTHRGSSNLGGSHKTALSPSSQLRQSGFFSTYSGFHRAMLLRNVDLLGQLLLLLNSFQVEPLFLLADNTFCSPEVSFLYRQTKLIVESILSIWMVLLLIISYQYTNSSLFSGL